MAAASYKAGYLRFSENIQNDVIMARPSLPTFLEQWKDVEAYEGGPLIMSREDPSLGALHNKEKADMVSLC